VLFFICLPALAQDHSVMQDSIKKLLPALPADTHKVNLLNKLAGSFLPTNTDTMVSHAQEARALAEKLHYNKGIADASNLIAIDSRLKGDYSASLEDFFRCIALYEKEKEGAKQAGVYIQLAQVYKDMSGLNQTEEYIDKGTSYSQQSYLLYSSLKDTAGMVNSLNMAGILNRDKGKVFGKLHYYDTAYQAYQEALGLISRSGKGAAYTGRLYNNLSQVFLEYRNDYRQALDYLFKAVAFNQANSNFNSLSFNYGNISHAYVLLHDYNQALQYAHKMLESVKEQHKPERMNNAWNQLYEVFEARGTMDSALHYYVLADQLDDSLNNVKKTNEVMHLQTKYETVQKEAQILRLQSEGADKNKRITFLAIGIIGFALLAGSMIWLYSRVRKQRQQIALQSKHMEMMMKELHHRVKNNLQIVSSLLSLQTYKVQDEEAVSVLRESQQRVQAMSFIHQRLYKTEDLTAVNMKEYLSDLAESLLSTYGFQRDQFDLQIKIDREMIDIDKALPIGLVINEMITNALKYAYAGIQHPSLLIGLTEDATNMTFVIRDNGIGINEQAWKQKSNSFGKQLITALCKQMRAKQALVVDGGTAFTLIIPKQVA
jgi:two-component sensor histidine kinase